jgi:hypothetical protein
VNRWITVADVLTIVTVAGVAVYVVGLVGLALAIRLRFTDGLSTAWYVVALLPRTIVAGQGVRIWLEWPIPFAMAATILATVLVSLTDAAGLAISVETARNALRVLIPALGFVALAVFLVFVLRSLQKAQRYPGNWERRVVVKHVVEATVMAAFGGILMAEGASLTIQATLQGGMSMAEARLSTVLLGPVLFIIGGFLIGVPAAALVDHPLPCVTIARHAKGEPEDTSVSFEGYLITHTDGYWHVFDDMDNLLSIPDAEVSDIRIMAQDHKQAP